MVERLRIDGREWLPLCRWLLVIDEVREHGVRKVTFRLGLCFRLNVQHCRFLDDKKYFAARADTGKGGVHFMFLTVA